MGPDLIFIWEEVPENTKIYFFEDLDTEVFKKLVSCHGRIINVGLEEYPVSIDWIVNFLEEYDPIYDNQYPTIGPPSVESADIRIVLTGILL